MNTQKGLVILGMVSLLGLSVSCSDRYAQGFAAGKEEGYVEGYDDGHVDGKEEGFQEAKLYFASADYNDGYSDGDARGYTRGFDIGRAQGDTAGYSRGYDTGYDDGHQDGRDLGNSEGYALGYDDGYDDGALDGVEVGYNSGYDDGHTDGANAGYDLGYDDGFGDGYDIGYTDGFGDASLSVGKSKKLQGYADILSMAHNDMIDYSKIKAPKSTARGLVADGRLLFEETSLTNKDTLKRAAVSEQYLVVEMAKQIKGKFGLSTERSLQIAKAANHFRKYSSSRALTAEDTSAYSSEIIGTDLKTIEKAFEQSRRGNLGSFQAVLEKAAEKNDTTPEKMGVIVSELFI